MRVAISRKLPILVSTRLVAVLVEVIISFVAVTNSVTRCISVFSMAPMFSCAPVSTSCSMMLASRSRSNNAVVSLRRILCVSIISLTEAVAVSFERSIAFCAVSCSSLSVRLTVPEAFSPAVLIMRVSSTLLSIIARAKRDRDPRYP